MKIELIARCVRGIEYTAADEIAALVPGDLTLGAREVRFQIPRLDPGLCGLRTPDDIFLSVGSAEGVGHRKDAIPWLAEQVRRMDWRTAAETVARVRYVPAPRRFDVVTSLVGRRNYSRYDVEDAIGSVLSAELDARYVSRRSAAAGMQPVALSVRVFINADTAGVAIRLAAGPLHRRSYKQDASRGTLHPPMAAVLAACSPSAPGKRSLTLSAATGPFRSRSPRSPRELTSAGPTATRRASAMPLPTRHGRRPVFPSLSWTLGDSIAATAQLMFSRLIHPGISPWTPQDS